MDNLTLGKLAYFSRFLNKIPLPFAKPANKIQQLKNLSTSLTNAGDELLWKTGHKREALLHMTGKGKTSLINMGKHNKAYPIYKKYPKTNLYTVHNHPQNTSLSPSDLRNVKTPSQQVIAVDRYGSRYRAYPKSKEDHNRLNWLTQAHKNQDDNNLRGLREDKIISDFEARNLAHSHARNRAFKRLNLIHYSAQIKNPVYTPELKAKVKELEEKYYNEYRKTLKQFEKYKELEGLI